MNLCETSNSDMTQIMESLQYQYLTFVGEQSEDKDRYFSDLKIILSVDSERETREAAEKQIMDEVVEAGELILHGDLLTDLRYETCKRSRRNSITAFERFDLMILRN